MKINSDDRKILELLRTSDYWSPRITKLAHALGIPTSTAQSKLKRLERGGVFHGFGAQLSDDTLGFPCFLVGYARDLAKTAPKLLHIEGTDEVHAIAGENNLLVRFRATDREDYLVKVQQMSALIDVELASLSAKTFR